MNDLPPAPIDGVHAVELGTDDAPALQALFDANPDYFLCVHGEVARSGEALEEILETPPAGWPYTKRWVVGYRDTAGHLVAIADFVADLLVAGVWHIGLFLIDATRHGTGDAQALCRALEAWARGKGANWMRLGVVAGNAPAERFWQRMGYAQTRTREGIAMGRRVNTVRVMMKPLAGGTIEEYLALFERDRPEPPAATS